MPKSYIIESDVVKVASREAIHIEQTLPVGVYKVELTQQGPQLRKQEQLTLPDKLLGDISKRAERVLHSFRSRDTNTGVLLSGSSGSGKSLLARKLSRDLLLEGVPTICLSYTDIDPRILEYLETIDSTCLIWIEELDKLEDSNRQNLLLSLMDGRSSSKKLFVMTMNDCESLGRYLQNRPGRILYHWRYKGISDDVVREYCKEHLHNQDFLEGIVSYAFTVYNFSFDMLLSVVEECNRFNEPVASFKDFLNISANKSFFLEAEVYRNGVRCDIQINGPTQTRVDLTCVGRILRLFVMSEGFEEERERINEGLTQVSHDKKGSLDDYLTELHRSGMLFDIWLSMSDLVETTADGLKFRVDDLDVILREVTEDSVVYGAYPKASPKILISISNNKQSKRASFN